jgi:6-phosphogluconolactonase
VYLGLGPDGHTASLFPGHALLSAADRAVAGIADSPKPPPRRVTLTLPTINAARAVAFVATGASKAAVVRAIFQDPGCPLPGALVRPDAGALDWFIDAAAAAELG